MGKNAKARASKKTASLEAVERLKNARKILNEQLAAGGIADTVFEVEEAGLHFSIVAMPYPNMDVKINAYGDMNNPSWIEMLNSFGFKENGTFTDNSPDENCILCNGSGIIEDYLN